MAGPHFLAVRQAVPPHDYPLVSMREAPWHERRPPRPCSAAASPPPLPLSRLATTVERCSLCFTARLPPPLPVQHMLAVPQPPLLPVQQILNRQPPPLPVQHMQLLSVPQPSRPLSPECQGARMPEYGSFRRHHATACTLTSTPVSSQPTVVPAACFQDPAACFLRNTPPPPLLPLYCLCTARTAPTPTSSAAPAACSPAPSA